MENFHLINLYRHKMKHFGNVWVQGIITNDKEIRNLYTHISGMNFTHKMLVTLKNGHIFTSTNGYVFGQDLANLIKCFIHIYDFHTYQQLLLPKFEIVKS